MAQFAVYRNPNPKTNTDYPFLLDVQSELFVDLHTRVVVPLTKAPALAEFPMAYLTPALILNGETYLMMTPLLAGITREKLGPQVHEVGDQRQQEGILRAVEFLTRGLL